MKKKILVMSFYVAVLSVFALTSCQSKEERIISRYESLCDEIDDNDDFDTEDLTRIAKEFREINDDAQGCDFTSEQQERLLKATGKISVTVAKRMPGLLFKSGGLLNNTMDLVKGFVDGLTDNSGDIEDAMNDIGVSIEYNESMEDIDEAMDDIDEAMDDIFDE